MISIRVPREAVLRSPTSVDEEGGSCHPIQGTTLNRAHDAALGAALSLGRARRQQFRTLRHSVRPLTASQSVHQLGSGAPTPHRLRLTVIGPPMLLTLMS